MIYRIIIFVFILITMSACFSEEKQKTAQLVAGLWQAEWTTIGANKIVNSESGRTEELVLTMKDLKAVDKEYEQYKITSISALSVYQNLPEQELTSTDVIKVRVESFGEQYERSYQVEDLSDVEKTTPVVARIISAHQRNDKAVFVTLFDTVLIPPDHIDLAYDAMSKIDSVYQEKSNKQNVSGFDFGKTDDHNEPVIIITYETLHFNKVSNYIIYVSRKSGKIIHMNIRSEALNQP